MKDLLKSAALIFLGALVLFLAWGVYKGLTSEEGGKVLTSVALWLAVTGFLPALLARPLTRALRRERNDINLALLLGLTTFDIALAVALVIWRHGGHESGWSGMLEVIGGFTALAWNYLVLTRLDELRH